MTTAERLRVAADLLDEVGLRPEVAVQVNVGRSIAVTVVDNGLTTPTDRWRAYVELSAALSEVGPTTDRDGRCFCTAHYRDCLIFLTAHAASPATAEVDA